MGPFETIVIEREGGGYNVTRAGETLLRVPATVFEWYEADSVFPPHWRSLGEAHPVRVLFWNPASREFLMTGLEAQPARTTQAFASSGYRAFLQGIWVPSPPVLLMRPFWNPPDPYDPFDEEAREKSFGVQREFLQILASLRPPEHWTAILNATDPYLEALGVNPRGKPAGEPDAIREVSLTPAGSLEDAAVQDALHRLGVHYAGSLFPVLRGKTLVGVHSLTLPSMHEAEALFDELGLLHQQGPYRPH